MTFYGLVMQGGDIYRPYSKFEAKDTQEAHELADGARKYDAMLFRYKGYKRVTKTGKEIYCIQEVLSPEN